MQLKYVVIQIFIIVVVCCQLSTSKTKQVGKS